MKTLKKLNLVKKIQHFAPQDRPPLLGDFIFLVKIDKIYQRLGTPKHAALQKNTNYIKEHTL
jgi:hypothetical protein